jgi:hypothetical protein
MNEVLQVVVEAGERGPGADAALLPCQARTHELERVRTVAKEVQQLVELEDCG